MEEDPSTSVAVAGVPAIVEEEDDRMLKRKSKAAAATFVGGGCFGLTDLSGSDILRDSRLCSRRILKDFP